MADERLDNEVVDMDYTDIDAIIKATQEELLKMVKNKHPEVDKLIEKYKSKYKDIFMYVFSEDEFYIYRPLKRLEYKRLAMQYKDDEEQLGEMLVITGVVYPKLDEQSINELKAGTVATLLELILAASNFGAQAPTIKL